MYEGVRYFNATILNLRDVWTLKTRNFSASRINTKLHKIKTLTGRYFVFNKSIALSHLNIKIAYKKRSYAGVCLNSRTLENRFKGLTNVLHTFSVVYIYITCGILRHVTIKVKYEICIKNYVVWKSKIGSRDNILLCINASGNSCP